MDNIMSLGVGAGLRVAEALAHASPTILCGLLVAGVFRRILGPQGTKKLFGGDSLRTVPQAWVLGMLLPVCSIGVLPIVREMRRSGLTGGAILAFALAAPLFNPLSVLYGLTLSHPMVILCFTFCSLVLVTVVGTLWGKLFRVVGEQTIVHEPVPYGWRRMAAVGLVACRETVGPCLLFFSVALLGVIGLAVFLPQGSLQFSMYHADARSPLLMSAVAFPAYTTPTTVMMQLGSMFEHGNSIGAALMLLVLGAGTNLGIVWWIARSYGVKATMGWLVLILAVLFPMAYAIEKPLYFAGDVPADHTHAFDMYCAPFPGGIHAPLQTAMRHMETNVPAFEWRALSVLGILAGIGLVLRFADPTHKLEAWLQKDAEEAPSAGRLDIVLPNWVLGGSVISGLVLFSLLGCYLYYPDPVESFEQIRIARVNALSEALSGNEEQTERHVEVWDDLTRKLEIGVMIRGRKLTPAMTASTGRIRDLLDQLRHSVEDGETANTKELVTALNAAHQTCREAFLGDEPAKLASN